MENDDVPPGLGPTGKFPNGKLSDDDEGELTMALGWDQINGVVRLVFGAQVSELMLEPPEAMALARAIIETIPEHRR